MVVKDIVYVGYPSVSLSPTLSKDEKVEQHKRKKTHKPNVLRFKVEGVVIPLYGLDSCLILVCLPDVSPLDFSNKWYQSRWSGQRPTQCFCSRRSVSMWKRVGYPSVSLSVTLSRNEKVKQHIRKKTHKSNVLKFWVESDFTFLCGLDSCLILVCLLRVSFLDFPK